MTNTDQSGQSGNDGDFQDEEPTEDKDTPTEAKERPASPEAILDAIIEQQARESTGPES